MVRLGVDLSASLQWPLLWDLAALMEAALANLVIQLVLKCSWPEKEGRQGGDLLAPICRKGFPKTMGLQFEFPSLPLLSRFKSPRSSTQMRSCMRKHFPNYFYCSFPLGGGRPHAFSINPSVPEVRGLPCDRGTSMFSVAGPRPNLEES